MTPASTAGLDLLTLMLPRDALRINYFMPALDVPDAHMQ
jgi:hypothetical protein